MSKYLYVVLSAMLFLGIMFFDATSVMACTEDKGTETGKIALLKDLYYDVKDEYPYYVITKAPWAYPFENKYTWALFYAKEPLYVKLQDNGTTSLGHEDALGFMTYCTSEPSEYSYTRGFCDFVEGDVIIESNHDIKYENGEDFFHKTPQPTKVETTLQKMVGGIQMMEVMKEILGLIPLVIGLLVLAISLRKGFLALQILLHRA